MTIREAARSTYRLFTAVLAGACRARYRAIVPTEWKALHCLEYVAAEFLRPGAAMRVKHSSCRRSTGGHCILIVFTMARMAFITASSAPAAWLKVRVDMMQPMSRKLASFPGLSVRSWRNAIARTTGRVVLLLRR